MILYKVAEARKQDDTLKDHLITAGIIGSSVGSGVGAYHAVKNHIAAKTVDEASKEGKDFLNSILEELGADNEAKKFTEKTIDDEAKKYSKNFRKARNIGLGGSVLGLGALGGLLYAQHQRNKKKRSKDAAKEIGIAQAIGGTGLALGSLGSSTAGLYHTLKYESPYAGWKYTAASVPLLIGSVGLTRSAETNINKAKRNNQ